MAGAGSGSAGVLAAGKTPTIPEEKVVSVYNAKYVPLYDLRTRSFPRDETGKVKLVHWVDQAVSLALGVANGAVLSYTELGNRLRTIKRAGGPRVAAEASDAIRVALKKLTERGDIGVSEVKILLPARGQIVALVTYINLRTHPNIPRDIQFVF